MATMWLIQEVQLHHLVGQDQVPSGTTRSKRNFRMKRLHGVGGEFPFRMTADVGTVEKG